MAGTGTPGVTYVPNVAVIDAVAAAAGALGVGLAADEMVEEAKSIAPVDTGAFQASIHAEVDGLTAAVGSDIEYAVYLEFGTSDTPTFATLRRASEATHI